MSKVTVTTSHWTREAASKIQATPTNTIPPFDVSKLRPLMQGYHVWDNWFVLDEEGNIASVFGFTVLIALVRPVGADSGEGERIAYFYSEDGTHYKAGGMLFDEQLYKGVREWSGSTILRSDGALQTFYTIAEGKEFNGVWQTTQRFATAIQTPSKSALGKLNIAPASYHALLKEPDGVLYETAEQASKREELLPTAHRRDIGSDQTENFCFRDPKFFKHPKTGETYILFEGNTGPKSGYPAGSVKQAYVGSSKFDPDYVPTVDDLKANGCVGVIKLTNPSYTYGTFMKPILTSNLVTDEIERINAFFYKGKFYLFVAAHGNKCTLVSQNADLNNRDYLLGFVGDDLFSKLKPLNGSGVVVQQKSLGEAYGGQETNQQYVYSWLLVPTKTGFDCVSYSNYSQASDGTIQPVKTAGPTLQIELKGDKTEITGMSYTVLAD